jgi:hypothetical protein
MKEYWCHFCDARVVNSEKPETGMFFQAFGHQYLGKEKPDGDYHSVLFAVCHECLPNLGDLMKEHCSF